VALCRASPGPFLASAQGCWRGADPPAAAAVAAAVTDSGTYKINYLLFSLSSNILVICCLVGHATTSSRRPKNASASAAPARAAGRR